MNLFSDGWNNFAVGNLLLSCIRIMRYKGKVKKDSETNVKQWKYDLIWKYI